METKAQTLMRLAECRRAYKKANTPEELALLLENTMLALQDLLYAEGIGWQEDSEE
jgi:hypothetical protein